MERKTSNLTGITLPAPDWQILPIGIFHLEPIKQNQTVIVTVNAYKIHIVGGQFDETNGKVVGQRFGVHVRGHR